MLNVMHKPKCYQDQGTHKTENYTIPSRNLWGLLIGVSSESHCNGYGKKTKEELTLEMITAIARFSE